MSYINKKKLIKLKEKINHLNMNGEEILLYIEKEGYDEFLFLANNIEIEKDNQYLIITADDVNLVIKKENEVYSLSIE